MAQERSYCEENTPVSIWAHVPLEATLCTIPRALLDTEADSMLWAQDFTKQGPCIYMYSIHSVELNFEDTWTPLISVPCLHFPQWLRHPTFSPTFHPQNIKMTFGNKNVPSYRRVSTYRRVFPTSFPMVASAYSGTEIIPVHRESIVNHFYFFHMLQISHLQGWICCWFRISLSSLLEVLH